MKLNKIHLLAVILVIILAATFTVYFRSNSHSMNASESTEHHSSPKDGAYESPRFQTRTEPTSVTNWVAVDRIPQDVDQTALSFSDSKFRLMGRGRNAKIVQDSTDREIFPDPERGIYGSFPSPDGERLLIYFGNADYQIRFSDSEKILNLPSVPSVPSPVGFAWQWLSNDLLVGIGGRGYDAGSKPESKCCDQHTVAESIIGVYRISDTDYSIVSLPNSLKGKVFDLGTRTKDGVIELIASGHEDDGKSLGWFSIAPE